MDGPERREILMETQNNRRSIRRSNTHAADFVRRPSMEGDRIAPSINTPVYQQSLGQSIHVREDSGVTSSLMSTDGQSLPDDLSDLGYDSENFYRDQTQFIYEKNSLHRHTIHESYEFSNFDELEEQERLQVESELIDNFPSHQTIGHGFMGQILQPSALDRKFVCIEAYEPCHPLELRLRVGDIVQGGLSIAARRALPLTELSMCIQATCMTI